MALGRKKVEEVAKKGELQVLNSKLAEVDNNPEQGSSDLLDKQVYESIKVANKALVEAVKADKFEIAFIGEPRYYELLDKQAKALAEEESKWH